MGVRNYPPKNDVRNWDVNALCVRRHYWIGRLNSAKTIAESVKAIEKLEEAKEQLNAVLSQRRGSHGCYYWPTESLQ